MKPYDYAIIGGGIVGLASARELCLQSPGARVVVIEKESASARHQSGRNSGVIHSGIYYKPGSLKAAFCKEGAEMMKEYCSDHGIPMKTCGKLIIANNDQEISGLRRLFNNATCNGISAEWINGEQAKEIEPHVSCIEALHVHSTGITSYPDVCNAMINDIEHAGGEICFDQNVLNILNSGGMRFIETARDVFPARHIINCAGLHSDRISRMNGRPPSARIIPFRGEYFSIVPSKSHMVKGLIYPAPDEKLPFLGVHLSKMIDGGVHAGPNAVLAFKREGYRKTDFAAGDLIETLAYGGFWKMASEHLASGLAEMRRSLVKKYFVNSLSQMLPDIGPDDLMPCDAGVRAQAVFDDGRLVDDFLIDQGPGYLNVINAPSPAATASLVIGRHIARKALAY
ncbi:MAG: L-2-hydroxyglutarate oxidase [Verrucomicrobiota bacterium]